MVRSRQGAEALAALEAAEVVVADFNDAASLTNALVGIDQAFLLTNSSEQAEDQQRGFVDVAKLVGREGSECLTHSGSVLLYTSR